MAGDYFEFRLPSFGKIKNPWKASTIILMVLIAAAVVVFFVFYVGRVSFGNENPVPPQQAAQNVLTFLNSNVNGTIQLRNITQVSGVYEITIIYQNQTIPVYATADGKYLIQSIIPIQ